MNCNWMYESEAKQKICPFIQGTGNCRGRGCMSWFCYKKDDDYMGYCKINENSPSVSIRTYPIEQVE